MIDTAPGGQTAPVLALENLTKSFRGKIALEGVSFSVPKASLTVILGHAGAGKTTTLRLIAGLDQPDAGRVLLAGRDVAGWEPKDRDIAMIFDNLALYPNKTGFENIANPLLIRKTPRPEIAERVQAMAKVLKIGHTLGRLPATMSGGERQRIALGRALIRTPSLFLLDEPLSSLDAKLRIELRAELRRLQSEHGYSFLMATPDFNEALAIADTVIMLRQGKVVQIATPQALYDQPVDRETARAVGAPLINILPARLDPDGGTIQVAGWRLPVPGHLHAALAASPDGFELGIRPENLGLVDIPGADLTGMVSDVEPLGLKSVLTVKKGEAEVRVLVESAAAKTVAVGREIGLCVKHPFLLHAFAAASGRRLAA